MENNITRTYLFQQRLLWLTHWSLVLTAFALPLSTTVKSIAFPITIILILASCQSYQRWRHVLYHPVTWGAVGLFGLVIIGMLWSDAPWAMQSKIIFKYLKLLYIPIIFLLAPDTLWQRRVINAFLTAITLIVLLGYVLSYTPVTLDFVIRVDSISHSYIEMGLMIAIAAYIYALRAVTEHRYRPLYWLLVLVLAYYQFFINTGLTGYIVFAFLAGLFLISQWRWWGGILAVLIVAGLLFAGYHVSSTVAHKLQVSSQSITQFQQDEHQTSIGFRLKFYQLSYELWREKPWLGWGTGGFADQYSKRGGIAGWEGILDQPHDEYMLWAVQYGLLGLLALLSFFATLLIVAWRSANRILLCGVVLACMLTGLFNTFLYVSASGYFFVLLVGVLFSQSANRPQSSASG
jgi:O-antigen ligase